LAVGAVVSGLRRKTQGLWEALPRFGTVFLPRFCARPWCWP